LTSSDIKLTRSKDPEQQRDVITSQLLAFGMAKCETLEFSTLFILYYFDKFFLFTCWDLFEKGKQTNEKKRKEYICVSVYRLRTRTASI